MKIKMLMFCLVIFAGCSGAGGASPVLPLFFTSLGPAGESPAGAARIRVRIGSGSQNQLQMLQTTDPSDVDQVVVQIIGPGIDAPVVANLVDGGSGVWSGTIPHVPAGSERVVSAQARNAEDVVLYSGVVTGVTVEFEQTAQIMMQMQESNPAAAFSNVAPLIQAFAMSGSQVLPGGDVIFAVTATDENEGDMITLEWLADGGSFDNTGSAQTIWTAPMTPGEFTLTLNVTDMAGAMAAMSVDVTVSPGEGSVAVDATFNNAPFVSSMTALPTQLVLYETTVLSAVATDPDTDPLSYQWSSNCGGLFSDATVAGPEFTAPDAYPANNQCVLTVQVDDGQGGTNSGSLTIHISPSAPVTIEEIDIQAPMVSGFDFSPKTIDTTDSYPEITVSLTIEDDIALPGAQLENFSLELRSPSGNQSVFVNALTEDAQAGATETLRIFVTDKIIPQGSEGGDWTVESLLVSDAVGNSMEYSTAQLNALGFPTILTNTGTTPPQPALTELSISPAVIDTTDGPVDLGFTLAVSGENLPSFPSQLSFFMTFSNVTGGQPYDVQASVSEATPESTDTYRRFQVTLTMPQYSASGIWRINTLNLFSSLGLHTYLSAATLSSNGFQTEVTNIATVQDLTPATLEDLYFETPVVSTAAASAEIELRVRLTDNISLGDPVAGNVGVLLTGPGTGGVTLQLQAEALPGGTDLDTVYELTGTLPQGSAVGEWRIISLTTRDAVGNPQFYLTEMLEGLGYVPTFTNQ